MKTLTATVQRRRGGGRLPEPRVIKRKKRLREHGWPTSTSFLTISHGRSQLNATMPRCVPHDLLSVHAYRMLAGALAIRCCVRFPSSGPKMLVYETEHDLNVECELNWAGTQLREEDHRLLMQQSY